MSSPAEVVQEAWAENRKESGETNAVSQRRRSQDELTITNQSEDKNALEDEDEEYSTSLSVGDGRYLVDLGSSSEFIVDEECILQLFKTCRECRRQCTVKKRVTGLKLVVIQECWYCQRRSEWTNLADDQDGSFQTNGKDAKQNSAEQ